MSLPALPITLAPEAQQEFDDAYDYFEGRRAGLAAVLRVLERIASISAMHQVVFQNVRRAVVQGFPYCVYYREEPTRVYVVSVFHARRDPATWQARAGESE